jgi:hypothetical protein
MEDYLGALNPMGKRKVGGSSEYDWSACIYKIVINLMAQSVFQKIPVLCSSEEES